MKIVETSTKEAFAIEIVPVESADYPKIGKKRYFFEWLSEREMEVYKLHILNSQDILGLISLEQIPGEWRVHIRLLTVSKENKGSTKKFENIAGNLIAHAAKIAVKHYGEMACVSLRPKSQIAEHYISKYNMNITGRTLSLEVPEILDLINTYDDEEEGK